MKYTLKHADTIGAINSSLCVAHCFATPFLFLTQAQTSLVELSTVPLWWQFLNYVFIVISFFAVSRTVKNSSNQLVKSLLWVSWVFLSALILNEEFEIMHMPELLTYFAGISLASLHIYNLKYCQCEDENCCPPNK
jgi:multidrug transporter EmrE-like cation transporter